MPDASIVDAPMQIGKWYRVPCIRASVPWLSTDQWLPVNGPLHNDAELQIADFQHYHIDIRFVESAILKQIAAHSAYVREHPEGCLTVVVDEAFITEGPVMRLMQYHRPMPLFQWHAEEKLAGQALERVYGHCTIDPENPVCPHRGIQLLNLPVDDEGVVVCPGHGLSWDLRTGECVRRYSESP